MPRTATAKAREPRPAQGIDAVGGKSAPAPVPMPEFEVAAHHEEIARISYRNWLERAEGPGSPEQDWLAAVSEVRTKYKRKVD